LVIVDLSADGDWGAGTGELGTNQRSKIANQKRINNQRSPIQE
jgi:hypothetical protein